MSQAEIGVYVWVFQLPLFQAPDTSHCITPGNILKLYVQNLKYSAFRPENGSQCRPQCVQTL